jgi:hypothetical protein
VVWEVQKLDAKTRHGDYWEKVSYIDENGSLKCIFLDPKTGSVQDDEPINRETIVPAFDPGEFDPALIASNKKKAAAEAAASTVVTTPTNQVKKNNNNENYDQEETKEGIMGSEGVASSPTVGGGHEGVVGGEVDGKDHKNIDDGLRSGEGLALVIGGDKKRDSSRPKTLADMFSKATRRSNFHPKTLASGKGGSSGDDDSGDVAEPVPWKFMFDPHEFKRLCWDFLLILPCLIYLTVMMPYRLCFSDEVQRKREREIRAH